ncbi:MAG: TetR/AcrR family transcriptional regulator [Cyanothece sp. SIO1E1]|nr:TetR/AcrR family transcriptional regulator [Cyanothece sp. SIO1E1]
MTKPSRETPYHHGDLRQSLIHAALELITEKQDANTLSLREVARRVGVSHAAPYRHFADKDALLAAVAEEGFHLLLTYLQKGMAKTPDDPVGQLQASGVAYVKFAISHPSHYRVMFGAFRADPLAYPSLNTAAQAAFDVMVNAIASGQQARTIKAGNPQHLAWVAWSLVHGLALLLIEQQLPITDEPDIAALAELATQSLTYGLHQQG